MFLIKITSATSFFMLYKIICAIKFSWLEIRSVITLLYFQYQVSDYY